MNVKDLGTFTYVLSLNLTSFLVAHSYSTARSICVALWACSCSEQWKASKKKASAKHVTDGVSVSWSIDLFSTHLEHSSFIPFLLGYFQHIDFLGCGGR